MSSAGGQLVTEARKRAGLTQAELAARMGTHQSVVARWETGRSLPSFENVRRAVRASGLDLVVGLSVLDDHDLALIRRELRLLPSQRLSNMVDAVRKLDRMHHSARG